MSGFTFHFQASRVASGALVFVVLALLGAIGLVVMASGRQMVPTSGLHEMLGFVASVLVSSLARS
jgi:hypothetical protein